MDSPSLVRGRGRPAFGDVWRPTWKPSSPTSIYQPSRTSTNEEPGGTSHTQFVPNASTYAHLGIGGPPGREGFVPGLRGVECSITPDGKVNPFAVLGARWFVYDGHPFASLRAGWFVYNGLGSVVATVDGIGSGQNWGEVRNVRRFDPFAPLGAVSLVCAWCKCAPLRASVWGNQRGTTIRTTTPTTEPTHGYCGNLGHTKDSDLGGLIYMRARYYEPWTGRFISEDPGRDGINWFVYAACNPVGNVDPDGEVIWGIIGLIGFLLTHVLARTLLQKHDYQKLAIGLRIAGWLIGLYGAYKIAQRVVEIGRPAFEKRRQEIEEQLTLLSQSVGQGSQLTRIAAGYAWREWWLLVSQAE